MDGSGRLASIPSLSKASSKNLDSVFSIGKDSLFLN